MTASGWPAAALATAAVALALPCAAGAAPARTTAVTFYLDGDATRAKRATLMMAFERALERGDRIEVLDKDQRLGLQAGLVDRDVLSEARGLLRSGEALLRAGRTREALARLATAAQQLEHLLANASKRELARAQFLVGVAHAILGDPQRARAAFVGLLTWRRGFEVDTALAPEKVLPVWDEARAHVERLPTGTIEVVGRPKWLQAFVDGRFIGFSPTSARRLTVGTHYVTLRAEGHQRQTQPVEVQADRRTHVRIRLEPSPRFDRAAAIVSAVADELGAGALETEMGELWSLFDVDRAVFLRPTATGYEAYLYDLHSGRRLAHATAPADDDADLERALAKLATALQADGALDMQAPDEGHASGPSRGSDDDHDDAGAPFYRRWWFWAGVGIAAAAVSAPLLLSDDGGPGGCPDRHVCGDVSFGLTF